MATTTILGMAFALVKISIVIVDVVVVVVLEMVTITIVINGKLGLIDKLIDVVDILSMYVMVGGQRLFSVCLEIFDNIFEIIFPKQ